LGPGQKLDFSQLGLCFCLLTIFPLGLYDTDQAPSDDVTKGEHRRRSRGGRVSWAGEEEKEAKEPQKEKKGKGEKAKKKAKQAKKTKK